MSAAPAHDRRVLFLAATARDAALTASALAPLDVHLDVCRSFDALLARLGDDTGVVLLPEEAASPAEHAVLRARLEAQAPWSDLPVLLLTGHGADTSENAETTLSLGNVTLLERPLRMQTLRSAVRAALRARERQHQLREHLAERARAEESLRVADRRKDEFLATLGHELRNPLAPLLSALHLLKRAGETDPVVQRVGAVMDRQVSALVRLVDDLLEVSRITRGLVDVRRDALDLRTVVHAAVDTSWPAIEAAGHQLVVDLPDQPVHVRGDAVRLAQVFGNLLTNAAKYTEGPGRLRVVMRATPDGVCVSVIDNGIGIAPDQLSSVFDMFTQVDRSSRRAQGGLGIGLTLVRSLVSMHDGRVEALSAGLDQGSEFRVHLPVAPGPLPLTGGTDGQPPLPPQRLLIVDDNRDAAEMLGQLLGSLGATVRTADSGPAALEALEEFAPDAVLLDIGMPGMDGYEVARRMRATARGGDLVLIALTGWGQEHDQQRALAAGFDHHVVKPAEVGVLRELLAIAPRR